MGRGTVINEAFLAGFVEQAEEALLLSLRGSQEVTVLRIAVTSVGNFQRESYLSIRMRRMPAQWKGASACSIS